MKKSGKDRLKCAVYESTRAPLTRSPFPNGEGKEEGASLPQKEANPASLRSSAPSKGRGSRGHSLLPMEGGAPKGRRLDGGSGMKKSGKDRLKCAINESTLSTATRSPFPNGEGKEEGLRRPKRKPTPPRCARQPLPREGARVDTPFFLWKEVPRRGGGWMGGSGMKKIGGDRLKYAIYESAAIPDTKPSPRGEGGERSEPDRVLAA